MGNAGNTDGTSRNSWDGEYENKESEISREKKTFWEYLAYALETFLILALLIPSLLRGTAFLIPFSLLGITMAILIIEHHAQHKEFLKAQIQGLGNSFSPYIGAWISGGKKRLMTTFLYEATSHCAFQPTTNTIVFQLKKDDNLYKNPLYPLLETVISQIS